MYDDGYISSSHYGTKRALRRVIKKAQKDKDYVVIKISDFEKSKKNPAKYSIRITVREKRSSYQPRARPRVIVA